MACMVYELLGAKCRIRTYEDVCQQIYSLPPLTAWVTWRMHALYTNERACAEPREGIGPSTSFLPRKRSATELSGQWLVRTVEDFIIKSTTNTE